MDTNKSATKEATKASVRKVTPQKPPAPAAGATVGAGAGKKAATTDSRPVVKKPTRLEETKARNKKAMVEALARAKAVRIPPPPVPPPPLAPAAVAEKPAKPQKPRKAKLVRDTFTMPEPEYAELARLKKRMAGLGGEVKKSELLRAGLGLLAALDNKALAAVMARVERVKTGRPKK